MKKKLFKLFVLSTFVLLLLCSIRGNIYAAKLSILPSTGIYKNEFTVDVQIDAEDDVINGADISILYSGPIKYSGVQPGDVNCMPNVTEGVGYINVICLIIPESNLTESKSIAKLKFTPTGAGKAELKYGEADLGDIAISLKTGAEFTINADPNLSKQKIKGTNYNTVIIYAVGVLSVIIIGGIIVYLLKHKQKALNSVAG